MKRIDHTAALITAIVYAGCADAVAGVLDDVAQEAGRRGEDERQMAAAVLAEAVRGLQRVVSARVSADLAAVRGN